MASVQKMTRFDKSMMWSLLHRFYMEAGPAAWSNKLVPQRSTSNAFCADTYATIIASFFKELMANGATKPPMIIELGGGSGRFAWQFLNRLVNYHFKGTGEVPDFTYMLTDGSEKNIANWQQKARFAPLVESGILKFAQLYIEDEPTLRTPDGDITPADLADRPVIFIANYLFDSIPANMVRVKNHEIEQVYVALTSSDPAFLKKPITSFATISEHFESRPIKGKPSTHPIINAALENYAKAEGDFHVVVPETCLRFVESFMQRSAPMLLLCGDIAYSDPAQFELESPCIFDSYFAHYTNLHIFGEMFRHYGGKMQSQRHKDTNFSCSLLSLPGKHDWQSVTLAKTQETAEATLHDFNPYDAHEILELVENSADELSIRQALALIRFSRFDPDVAEACVGHMLFQIEQGEEKIDRPQIYETFMEAYRAYFPDGSEDQFDCNVAQMLLQLRYYAQALQLIEHAISESGPSAPRLFAKSLALLNLGDRDRAAQVAREAAVLDPAFAPVQRLIAGQFTPKPAAKSGDGTAKLSYEHLLVDNTDPKVVSKAVKLMQDKGAVLIKDVLHRDLVEELRVAVLQRANNWRDSNLGKPNNVGDKRYTVPIRINGPFSNPAVFANSVLVDTLRNIMGEKPVLHAFGAVVTYQGARMQHVHREHPLLFNTHEGNANVPCYASTILIPLIDLDEEAGGTQLWEGTHTTRKDEEWSGDPHVIYTPAGSALMFDYRTYHGGMPCAASHGRPLLYFTYTMPWFHDTLAFESHAALGLTDQELLAVPEQHRDLFRFAKKLAA